MPAIPSIASFTGPSVTEGEFKTALANLHLFLSDLLGTSGTQAGAQAAMGAILGAGMATKAAAYTVASTDRGKVIACSGTFTVTLPDAVAVGAGFAVAVGNYGVGTITVDPFSTQTIDGAATKSLGASTMMVACSLGGGWLTVGGVTLPTASTSTAGIVQLVDSYESTSQSQAPTANALSVGVDVAWNHANSAFNTANAAYNRAYASVHHDQGHNIVGSLCFACRVTTGTYTTHPGDIVAGADLRPASAGGWSASPLAGTWRCLGYAVNSGQAGATTTTLWQRIS